MSTEVFPFDFSYVALRMYRFLTTLDLVSPLIKSLGSVNRKAFKYVDGFGHFVTLSNLAPKEFSFVLSTHFDVFGSLGHPWMVV